MCCCSGVLTQSFCLCLVSSQMFMSEAGKIGQKIKVWFNDYFNISDFAAIVSFFVGFGLRFGAYEESVFIAGRTVYCLNIIFWYVRLLDILAVNQQAGPYVMMIGKMVRCLYDLFFSFKFNLCMSCCINILTHTDNSF